MKKFMNDFENLKSKLQTRTLARIEKESGAAAKDQRSFHNSPATPPTDEPDTAS